MKTLVLGASLNPERYANRAVKLLQSHEHEVIAVGIDEGEIGDSEITHDFPKNGNIDTVTVYLNPVKQRLYYDKILSLKPRRIIFNPGAENQEFEKMAEKVGIETTEACTLVLLNTGQF